MSHEEFEKLENTLQSIGDTLKRIEGLLIVNKESAKTQTDISVTESISDGVMKSVSSAIHGTGEEVQG